MSASVQRSARLPTLAGLRNWRPQLSTEALIALTSLFFAVAGNGLFWHSAMASHPGSLRYALSLLLLLLGGLTLAHALSFGLLFFERYQATRSMMLRNLDEWNDEAPAD